MSKKPTSTRLATLAAATSLLWAAQASAACPADFRSFVGKFEADPVFQQERTRYPLAASRIDNQSADEPFEVKFSIRSPTDKNYPQVAWPSRARQASAGLKRSIVQEPGGIQAVTFSQPGTDYMFSFYFKKSGACWTLVRFADFSL